MPTQETIQRSFRSPISDCTSQLKEICGLEQDAFAFGVRFRRDVELLTAKLDF
jgi:hypothetical protein